MSAWSEGDLVLLARLTGQAIDCPECTKNLVVGTREDIAAQNCSSRPVRT